MKALVLDVPQTLQIGEVPRPSVGRVALSSASARTIPRKRELHSDCLNKPIRVQVKERGLFLAGFFGYRLFNPSWVPVLPPAKVIL